MLEKETIEKKQLLNILLGKAGYSDQDAVEDAIKSWPVIQQRLTLSGIRAGLEAKARVARDSEKTEAEKQFEDQLNETRKREAS